MYTSISRVQLIRTKPAWFIQLYIESTEGMYDVGVEWSMARRSNIFRDIRYGTEKKLYFSCYINGRSLIAKGNILNLIQYLPELSKIIGFNKIYYFWNVC